LLQQVDNFVSDRESSSIAMGTSATSNPPSLVTHSLQNQSPKNHDIFGSPDEDMKNYIERDVQESLMNVNTGTLRRMKNDGFKSDGFKQPNLPNSNLHVQPLLSVSTNNTNSRHSSNTASQQSRNLPSYEEAVQKKQAHKLKNEQQLRSLANYLQDESAPQSPSFVSSTLPRNSGNQNYSTYSTPNHGYSTLQRTTSAQQPNSPPTMKHANKVILTSSPSQPLSPTRSKVESHNMDYC
jgi:hypothetical protein